MEENEYESNTHKQDDKEGYTYRIMYFACIAEWHGNGGAVSGTKTTAVFTAEMQSTLEGAQNVLLTIQPFPDEAAVGFFKNGRSLPKGYLEQTADKILEQRGKFTKVAELTRTTLAYSAAGATSTTSRVLIFIHS